MCIFWADDTNAKYWTSVEEKENSVIKSWTFFSKGLSFIGRVLVVNSLCSSRGVVASAPDLRACS